MDLISIDLASRVTVLVDPSAFFVTCEMLVTTEDLGSRLRAVWSPLA